MELTKEKIEIISHIKPFMDKTLSDGCLIRFDNSCYRVIENLSNRSLKYLENIKVLIDNKWTIWEINYQDWIYEIIWHYEITAIYKFCYNEITNWDEKFFYCWKINKKIPNKHLSLYLQEEDKEILEILNLINKRKNFGNQ